jgi:POT family proton-dependent oligopeptide transporter
VTDPGSSLHRALPPGDVSRGLLTLFMVEMWERFAFYGMRALLVLFLVAPLADGGLALPDASAAAIYGLYTAMASLMGVVGGWAADRGLGARRCVELGGWLNIAGNGLVALGALQLNPGLCFVGLALDATGTGFLKPNASVAVARLFPEGGARRDAGVGFFYMGINLGAVLGSLLVPVLAAKVGWWAGFVAAAVGMGLGLLQWYFSATTRLFDMPDGGGSPPARGWGDYIAGGAWIAAGSAALGLFAFGLARNPVLLAELSTGVMVLIGVLGFGYLLTRPDLTPAQRRDLWGVCALGSCISLFLVGYQQGGTSINLFIQRFTDRTVAGWEIPAGAFQSLLPATIILLSPLVAALWIALGRRGVIPAAPVKMGIGIGFLGLAFAVMSAAAASASGPASASVWWIVGVFALVTLGDLLVYPVYLSAVSALSPPSRASLVMGLTSVFGAMGNVLSSLVAGRIASTEPAALAASFQSLAAYGLATGACIVGLGVLWSRRAAAGVRRS